ncbi:MAG: DUF4157 domain-containing protein [Paenibacillaceae bacterium]
MITQDHSKRTRSAKSMKQSNSSLSPTSHASQSQASTAEHIMQLQKTSGNRAVMQLMKSQIQKKENKTGMPDNLKSGVEALSGTDMSDVRVNYNSDKPDKVNALAYAQGNDIHVGPGQEEHLPHEAWHVVQQKHSRVNPTLQAKGLAINDDDALEREADVMGAKAMQMKAGDSTMLSDGENTSAPVAQLQDDYYPSGDKEPHIHMHPGGITYTGVGHNHKHLQSGDQVRESAIMEVYQDLQALGTARALDIIQWIQGEFGIDPPEEAVVEEYEDEGTPSGWAESEMEDHNPEGEAPMGFSYGSYTSKLK